MRLGVQRRPDQPPQQVPDQQRDGDVEDRAGPDRRVLALGEHPEVDAPQPGNDVDGQHAREDAPDAAQADADAFCRRRLGAYHRPDDLDAQPVQDRHQEIDDHRADRPAQPVLAGLQPMRQPIGPGDQQVGAEDRRRAGGQHARQPAGLVVAADEGPRRGADLACVADQVERQQRRDGGARDRDGDQRRRKAQPQGQQQTGDQPAGGADQRRPAQQAVEPHGHRVVERRDPDRRCVRCQRPARDDDEGPGPRDAGMIDPDLRLERPEQPQQRRRGQPRRGDEGDDRHQLDGEQRKAADDAVPVAGPGFRRQPAPPRPRRPADRAGRRDACGDQDQRPQDHAADAALGLRQRPGHVFPALVQVGERRRPARDTLLDGGGHLGEPRLDGGPAVHSARRRHGVGLGAPDELVAQQRPDVAVGQAREHRVDRLGRQLAWRRRQGRWPGVRPVRLRRRPAEGLPGGLRVKPRGGPRG